MTVTKVLVIEDNAADFDLIEAHLGPTKKYDLSHVTSLEAGLKAAKKADVVLLDLDLTDTQGEETLKQYFSKFSDSTTIVFTGRNDEAMARKAIRIGARDYLVKGLDPLERLHHQIMLAQEMNRDAAPVDESDSPKARLVLVKGSSQLASIAKHAAAVSTEEGVALLTVTRSPGELDASIAASGGVTERLQFIDATPAPGLTGAAEERTLIVGSPMQLERMQMRIEVAVKRLPERTTVLVDSLDALTWHNGLAQVTEFIQVLCARLRSKGVGVHLATKDVGSPIATQVAALMDEEPLNLD